MLVEEGASPTARLMAEENRKHLSQDFLSTRILVCKYHPSTGLTCHSKRLLSFLSHYQRKICLTLFLSLSFFFLVSSPGEGLPPSGPPGPVPLPPVPVVPVGPVVPWREVSSAGMGKRQASSMLGSV